MLKRFPTVATTCVVASFTLGNVFGIAVPASAEQTVTCESNNSERNVCPIEDTRGGVRLVKQLSDTSCDGNWGYNRNRIWVRHGCRAEFLVGNRNYSGLQVHEVQ